MAKHKILVIDDDQDILDAIRFTLEDEGYLVETSKNAGMIDDMSENNIPSLIILDVLLEGDDGRQISRKLKGNPVTKNIPVILVSADTAAKKYFSYSKASDFLSKPFDIDELLSKIKNLLKK